MGALRKIVLLSALSLGLASLATPAVAATRAHAQTINVVCSSSGFTTDGNALRGQITEVSRFFAATGIACRLYDGTTRELLYDPSL